MGGVEFEVMPLRRDGGFSHKKLVRCVVLPCSYDPPPRLRIIRFHSYAKTLSIFARPRRPPQPRQPLPSRKNSTLTKISLLKCRLLISTILNFVSQIKRILSDSLKELQGPFRHTLSSSTRRSSELSRFQLPESGTVCCLT